MDFCLKLEHYRDTDNEETKDRRRIKPRTADLYGIVRHKSAEISRSEIYLDVRPRPQLDLDGPMDQQRTDQMATGAEVAETALQSVIHHPRYGYDEPRDLLVLAGLSARIGVVTIEWDPKKRPYGELVYRNVRFEDICWTIGTHGPHDPQCWWVCERKRMTPDMIRGMKKFGWQGTDDFVATGNFGDVRQGNDPSLPPGSVRLSNSFSTEPGKPMDDVRVNVLFMWMIEDEDDSTQQRSKYTEMAKHDYYLACPDCGYEEHIEDGTNLPKSGPCPICSGTMHRIEMQHTTAEALAYPDGRLIICPEDGPDTVFYDGEWDCPTRSFRHMTFEPYPHPYEPVGLSDTKLHRNMQLIIDSTFRLAYEQMSENRHLIVTLEDGLTDANGEPWMFSDAQGRVAYARDLATLNGIRDFQGAAVPNGWSEFITQLRNAFIPNFGTTDIYLDPSNTKNIPVGTLERMQQTKELPVLHHVARLQRRESIFFGVTLDMIRSKWTERRWLDYMGPEGTLEYKLIQGTALPDAHVLVTASPEMAKVSQDDAQGLQMVFGAFMQSPAIGEAMARALNVPPDQIAKLKADLGDEQGQNMGQILQKMGMPPQMIQAAMQAFQMSRGGGQGAAPAGGPSPASSAPSNSPALMGQ